ncbi:LITAF-like zinc ribbon domain-containing protein [Hyaloscypha finlandica]|nr:LITAF-like zinc ribbon domain-containing protein [Hyaloscypha sp. PMI_1271]KAH8764008.1 LITAF-like zinc ribbon domain-containing protein [Hyaloscypha finlandica]
MASPQYTAEQPQYHTEQPAMQPIEEKNYPQQGMPQQPMAQQPMPANNFASATPLVSLQQGPAPVDCPMCRVRQMTRVEFVSGGTTHLIAILCCLGLCCGCVPYLTTWFKDVEHKCGNCGALLAVWHRSGRTEVIAHATM